MFNENGIYITFKSLTQGGYAYFSTNTAISMLNLNR